MNRMKFEVLAQVVRYNETATGTAEEKAKAWSLGELLCQTVSLDGLIERLAVPTTLSKGEVQCDAAKYQFLEGEIGIAKTGKTLWVRVLRATPLEKLPAQYGISRGAPK